MESESFHRVSAARPGERGFRAIQGDTAVTCVDWQAFHCWQDGDQAFSGVVTVQDIHGRQYTLANWPSPTDDAADTALGHTGWQRVGPWNPDENGRRSAQVLRSPTAASVRPPIGGQ